MTVTGERASVEVAGQLDVTKPYDLVLVTVLAPQVGAVLPALMSDDQAKIVIDFLFADDAQARRPARAKASA